MLLHSRSTYILVYHIIFMIYFAPRFNYRKASPSCVFMGGGTVTCASSASSFGVANLIHLLPSFAAAGGVVFVVVIFVVAVMADVLHVIPEIVFMCCNKHLLY